MHACVQGQHWLHLNHSNVDDEPLCLCVCAQVSVCAGVTLSPSSSSSSGAEASARGILKSCKKEMEGAVAEERLKVQLAKESADAEVRNYVCTDGEAVAESTTCA